MHSDARKGMIEAQVEDFICNWIFFWIKREQLLWGSDEIFGHYPYEKFKG